MSTEREPIAVIGTGYVGLVTAAGFAELGHEALCVDVDADKVARLAAGEVPIYEPGLPEVLDACRGRLHFSTELGAALERARLLFVCVGTPPTYSGDADLSAVYDVVASMPASDAHALVMKSTVPPGTGTAVKRALAQQGKPLAYVSCPEFLREGSAIEDFRHPDRVVVGDDGDWAGDAVVALYEPLGAPLVRTDIVSAEMVKLATNAFLSTKISFINEIANVCEETGADVLEVARGMGLDSRVGPAFLRPGIGFGGSCLPGDETVLVRQTGDVRLTALRDLFADLALSRGRDPETVEVLRPADLEVLSWDPRVGSPRFSPVSVATRREFVGDLIEVRTKMGRRITATPDHPFVSADADGHTAVRVAGELDAGAWLPVAQLRKPDGEAPPALPPLLEGAHAAGVDTFHVIARPAQAAMTVVEHMDPSQREAGFAVHPKPLARWHDVRRSGAMRLDEMLTLGLPLDDATLGTARNGTYVPTHVQATPSFWRVIGLYLAEGHCSEDGARRRLQWSFHPTAEMDLVEEVRDFWAGLGVNAAVRRGSTSTHVSISSRVLAGWWTGALGLGRNCYEQRIPDLAWEAPEEHRRALLTGMWAGDGSWSYICGGPSVILEYGTASRELADGLLRLLGDMGVMASQRIGRTRRSTRDTHWLRVSGSQQVERMVDLAGPTAGDLILRSIPPPERRKTPTGYRRHQEGAAWVRVVATERRPFDGHVYSLEVPGPQTFVSTGGLVVHNCFPKDISALKQLAGNSGYHFQLLNAVIEVNELQKRRVVAKLQKHVGELAGKRVALLGVAFKPDTDDMREASSLVLAARLLAEGAQVSAYDPVAEDHARELMPGVDFPGSALAALQDADACVLVTEWAQFAELDWAAARRAMRGNLIVDGRNALEPAAVRASGLTYEGIGRT